MKQAQLDYEWHYEIVGKKEKETGDLLHELELAKKYEDRVKAVPKLTKVRKERRVSKDIVENTEPIVDYFEVNKKFLNGLAQLLGEIRKVEKKHNGRIYKPRVRDDLSISQVK